MRRCLLVAATLVLTVTAAHAEDEQDFVDEGDVKKVAEENEKMKEEQKEGWTYKLTVGLNTAFTHNEQVVGAQQGVTWQIGGIVEGGATLIDGQHEWSNKLAIEHAQTFTEALDRFVKTTDNLEIRSMYLYSLEAVPWLGPFARARLQTQILEGELVREGTKVRRPEDGANPAAAGDAGTRPGDLDDTCEVNSDGSVGDCVVLTDPFEPLLLRQSAGMFARPLKEKAITLTATLGIGALELIADGFAAGEETTEEDFESGEDFQVIPLSPIQTVVQVGVEVEVEATGALNETLSYTAFTNFLMPFYTSEDIFNADGDQLEGFDLLNIELGAKLSAKIAKWASVDYVLSAKRLPIVIDEWQIQNQVLLSSAFNLL